MKLRKLSAKETAYLLCLNLVAIAAICVWLSLVIIRSRDGAEAIRVGIELTTGFVFMFVVILFTLARKVEAPCHDVTDWLIRRHGWTFVSILLAIFGAMGSWRYFDKYHDTPVSAGMFLLGVVSGAGTLLVNGLMGAGVGEGLFKLFRKINNPKDNLFYGYYYCDSNCQPPTTAVLPS